MILQDRLSYEAAQHLEWELRRRRTPRSTADQISTAADAWAAGYSAYHSGVKRCELVSKAGRAGFDYARSEHANECELEREYREMMANLPARAYFTPAELAAMDDERPGEDFARHPYNY